MEQDNEPQGMAPLEVAGQDGESRLTLGVDNEGKKSNASVRVSKAATDDETTKQEILGGTNEDTKAAGEDCQMKEARDVNEEEMEDKNEVKKGEENQGDVDKEKREIELEPKADKSDNESIGVEGKGLDFKKGSETEQVEWKLEGSSNEEDKQDDDKGSKKRKRKENARLGKKIRKVRKLLLYLFQHVQ